MTKFYSGELQKLREEQFKKDPSAFWTAGQLRSEMKLKLDDKIPDCAIIHRSAVRCLMSPAAVAEFKFGKITFGFDVIFDEPFVWHEMTWEVPRG